jgi:hypothetical protein
MSITKATGMLIIMLAGVFLVIALINIGPSYSAAPTVLDKSDVYGLNTDSTNVRFAIGGRFLLQVIIVAMLGLAGWWLTTQEVRQLWYVYGLAVFVLFSFIVRGSPMAPYNIARMSPAMLFYGAAVELQSFGDTTAVWVPIPISQNYRVGVSGIYQDASQMGSTEVVLDFHDDARLMQAFITKGGQAKLTGHLIGTRPILMKKDLFVVPLVKVDAVN